MPRSHPSVRSGPDEAESADRRDLDTDRTTDATTSLLRQGYRFALSLTHDRARAEDLLHDAWIAVRKANGPRTARYLITAIRSCFVDRCRRALIAPMESLDTGPQRAANAEDLSWDDPYDAVAMKSALERALGLLRPEERAVLLLSAVEGYTAREIGELLDAPRGTVLSLMHRTRAKMRRWLADPTDSEERR
ncbi:MAG TPA: RNA polymerase sigma factor [Candidatus Polarisedimenticolaceae bacterium]|nr:RNA polymerase sigma factor [Candidatus Polarisedimenticolaceae bacterium]